MLCVLCLANIGFVQCFSLGSWKYFARLCFVLLFSKLCYACFPSQTSGLCSAIPSVPESFLHACVLFYYSVNYVMRALPHKHRVCAVLFPRFLKFFARLCLFYYSVKFCYACFASQTSGLCSAFPSLPVIFCQACFVLSSKFCYACFASQTTVCAVLLNSLGSG